MKKVLVLSAFATLFFTAAFIAAPKANAEPVIPANPHAFSKWICIVCGYEVESAHKPWRDRCPKCMTEVQPTLWN